MSKLSPIHRVPLSEDQIAALIDFIDTARTQVSADSNVISSYKKLRLMYFKVEEGMKTPDYVNTGASSRESRTSRTLDSLGATEDEKYTAMYSSQQKDDAIFAAGDHLIATGNRIEWWKCVQEVIDLPVKSRDNIESDPANDSNDAALFAALTHERLK